MIYRIDDVHNLLKVQTKSRVCLHKREYGIRKRHTGALSQSLPVAAVTPDCPGAYQWGKRVRLLHQ